MDTTSPQWPERFCVSLAPRKDPRVCFDIRDDFDPKQPPDDPSPLLHFGCLSLAETYSNAAVSLDLPCSENLYDCSKPAHFSLRVQPTLPAPPPAPPSPPLPPRPPPSPPSSPPPPPSAAEEINRRFAEGGPSPSLKTAGVLIHQFDAMDDPNPEGVPWIPGVGRQDTGDRISAALVYANMEPDPRGNIPIYSFDLGGFVLSPTNNNFLCGYPMDVGSLTRTCNPQGVTDWCIPGCTPYPGHSTWCDLNHDQWPCAYRPESLTRIMTLRDGMAAQKTKPQHKMWDDGKYYDELIFESAAYMRELPKSVEAIFYTTGTCGDVYDGPKCAQYARAAHGNFLRHFGLTAKDVPLLKFDLFNWQQPFEDVS